MGKGRLEAFTDGVFAIIITIMVLELKVPHGADFATLSKLLPTFLSYVLSFLFVAIYWNNHHHMFHAVQRVNGSVLWANIHLLFWLSLIPFVTGWMGENHFESLPVALYGVVLICCAIAYTILSVVLLRHHGPDSTFAKALGSDLKGKISLAIYAIGVAVSISLPWAAGAMYALVALIWLVPDKRFERAVGN